MHYASRKVVAATAILTQDATLAVRQVHTRHSLAQTMMFVGFILQRNAAALVLAKCVQQGVAVAFACPTRYATQEVQKARIHHPHLLNARVEGIPGSEPTLLQSANRLLLAI